MSEERYPADLILTADHFANSGWQEALQRAERDGYPLMWHVLTAAAQQAMAEGKAAEGKVLWLLADASSMMLKPESVNNPFAPIVEMGGKRSALPEDFSDSDIEFFKSIVEKIDDPWLKGRLSDLIWICPKKKDPKYALMAIDAYRQLGLDNETWIHGSRECWSRAIRLSIMLGKGSGKRLVEMRDEVLSAFAGSSPENGYLGLGLSDLLDEHDLARDHACSIAVHLEHLAMEFEKNRNFLYCRDYYDRASHWYRKAGDVKKSVEVTVRKAEGFVDEAQERISSGNPSYVVAARFYEDAIQIYRTIPRTEREPYQVDERLNELRETLRDACEKATNEMKEITIPGLDISDMIQQAQESVRGKELSEAFAVFANNKLADVKLIRESGVHILQEHPSLGLFPSTTFSNDGRVIAKNKGVGFGETETGFSEEAIWAQMIQHYSIIVGVAVQGRILPALEVLNQEHRLIEHDFVCLCTQSPVVPRDRVRLWGKALYAGYDHDFATAIHLLSPQIEHLVRINLRAEHVQTTTLNQDGIETENGLSTLMEIPEVEQIFGPDIAFEIRALFCNANGPNLRNQTAHGLLTFEDCQSAYVIYAWWFAFRLVFSQYWSLLKRTLEEQAALGSENKPPD